MGKDAEEWLLYVDESGDFEKDACSCVIGLAIRDVDSREFQGVLRDAISRCVPVIPWPPHATELNIPVSRVAACMLSSSEDESVRRACDPAIRALRREAERSAEDAGPTAFVRAVNEGRMPDYAVMQAADGWLRRAHPRARQALLRLRNQQRRQLRTLLAAMLEHYGPDDVFLVGAAQRADETPREQAYVSCLGALLERLVALLAEPEEQRTIRFRVATRWVTDPFLEQQVPLNAKHIVEAARDARGFAEQMGFTPNVRLVPLEHVTRYDAQVHPGVVLADFLANRLRGPLGEKRWKKMVAAIDTRVALAPETRARAVGWSLPSLAHDGAVRQWLERALRGDLHETPALPPVRSDWAREQALRWADAAREHAK